MITQLFLVLWVVYNLQVDCLKLNVRSIFREVEKSSTMEADIWIAVIDLNFFVIKLMPKISIPLVTHSVLVCIICVPEAEICPCWVTKIWRFFFEFFSLQNVSGFLPTMPSERCNSEFCLSSVK